MLREGWIWNCEHGKSKNREKLRGGFHLLIPPC
jgi:hypothetical protein